MKCLQIEIPEMGKCIIRVGHPDDIANNPLDVATEELRQMLEDGAGGDRIIFELVEMTDQEYAALPDWDGW